MTIKRANDFIDGYLRENLSYLIIAHGFFLRVLSREMKKRGFKGNTINFLKNGQYYSYRLMKGDADTSGKSLGMDTPLQQINKTHGAVLRKLGE
jgi:hypothetical protein